MFVAEEPGVGLGSRFAGLPGPTPAHRWRRHSPIRPWSSRAAAAREDPGGRPSDSTVARPLRNGSKRVRRRGSGMWLHAIAWPASAGHLLAEEVVLHDLTEWTPPELVYGAPSPYLHGRA
ncbi:DUF6758 family protein [Micromonospora sp. BRA006-A]|nr:DUF6758 family protein [Micromonospora sp. BRA006-A]